MVTATPNSYNQKMMDLIRRKRAHTNVLIIGNNPIEMTTIYNNLNNYRSKNYITDVCFSVKDSIARMLKSRPDCILLDDNIVVDQLKLFIKKIKENTKFRNIPIVLLKSSNFNFAMGNEVQDFLLKGNLTTEILSNTIDKNTTLIKKLLK